MNHQSDQALQVALAAVEQLTQQQQKRLTERLISTTIREGNLVAVYLKALPPPRRNRLAVLMDKNNNARLSRKEKLELKRLGSEVDEMLLANSQALAYALRPELFDERGLPIKTRFQQALKLQAHRRVRAKYEGSF